MVPSWSSWFPMAKGVRLRRGGRGGRGRGGEEEEEDEEEEVEDDEDEKEEEEEEEDEKKNKCTHHWGISRALFQLAFFSSSSLSSPSLPPFPLPLPPFYHPPISSTSSSCISLYFYHSMHGAFTSFCIQFFSLKIIKIIIMWRNVIATESWSAEKTCVSYDLKIQATWGDHKNVLLHTCWTLCQKPLHSVDDILQMLISILCVS